MKQEDNYYENLDVIKMCLNCERPKCTNCLGGVTKGTGIGCKGTKIAVTKNGRKTIYRSKYEAARMLGIARSSIYKAIERGKWGDYKVEVIKNG